VTLRVVISDDPFFIFAHCLEAVFIGFNIELARQIFANQGDVFAACQEGKQENVDDEWRKSDRQGDIKSYEHSFLLPILYN